MFFGEPIPQKTHSDSIMAAKNADLFILIGTTGEIMPTSSIPYIAKENGAKFIEINIEPSKYTYTIVDILLKGKASDVMLKLENLLEL